MMMKKRFIYFPIVVLLASLSLQSCLNDNDDDNYYNYPNALVTIKNLPDNSFYMQLDDSTTLEPVNIKTSPYGQKNVRALVNFVLSPNHSTKYTKAVQVNWMDSILTKQTVVTAGAENDKKYGNDPVEIVNDWITIAEDGYLTLRFRTVWSGRHIKHSVNLLTNENPANPYELEFRHNANGDTSGESGDALVAFDLKQLPDTQGKTVKLKLKWKSFTGDKSVEFNYCTRKSTGKAIISLEKRTFVTNIK